MEENPNPIATAVKRNLRQRPTVSGPTIYGSNTELDEEKLAKAREYLGARALALDVSKTRRGLNPADAEAITADLSAKYQAAKAAGVTPEQIATVANPPTNLPSMPSSGGGRVYASPGLLTQFAETRRAGEAAANDTAERAARAAVVGSAIANATQAESLERAKRFRAGIEERAAIDKMAKADLSASRQARTLARANLRAMRRAQAAGRYLDPRDLEGAQKYLERTKFALYDPSNADERLEMFRRRINPVEPEAAN